MFRAAFNEGIYEPLYNALVYLIDIVPGHDVGIAVIILTLAVKVLLIPLSRQAIRTQVAMRAIAPDMELLKAKYKDNQEEQARAMFALYKERGIRPFSTFFLVLLQLPILFGLYWVFWKGGLPAINTEILYSFVPSPPKVDMSFLGLIDMGERSILLAVLTGVTQYIYTRLSMGPRQPKVHTEEASFSADMARSFDLQARYVLPILFTAISYSLSAALPLYWATSNIFMIGQELLMGRGLKQNKV